MDGSGFEVVDALVRQTDSTGIVRFQFLASLFGGVERIQGRMLCKGGSFDTLSVRTRVPGLDSLGPGDHYVLTGTPFNWSGTNDPCRPTPPTSQHYFNHFGTSRLQTAIQQIASRYDSLFPGIRLRVNDLTLRDGGGFDTGNQWERDIEDQYLSDPNRCNDHGHCTHREGWHADIGWRGVGQSNNCVDISLKKIRQLIRDVTGNRPYTEGDHEHITVGP
jgi:hypothetical protein